MRHTSELSSLLSQGQLETTLIFCLLLFSYELVKKRHEQLLEAEEVPPHPRRYYVWDNVSLALHVGKKVTLPSESYTQLNVLS